MLETVTVKTHARLGLSLTTPRTCYSMRHAARVLGVDVASIVVVAHNFVLGKTQTGVEEEVGDERSQRQAVG